jgi:hypothetical protein
VSYDLQHKRSRAGHASSLDSRPCQSGTQHYRRVRSESKTNKLFLGFIEKGISNLNESLALVSQGDETPCPSRIACHTPEPEHQVRDFENGDSQVEKEGSPLSYFLTSSKTKFWEEISRYFPIFPWKSPIPMFHEILLTLLGYHSDDLFVKDDIHHTFTLNLSSSSSDLFHDSESQQLSHLLSLGWYSQYLSRYIQQYSLQWHGNHCNLQKYSAYQSALCLGIHEIHEVQLLHRRISPLLGVSFKSS